MTDTSALRQWERGQERVLCEALVEASVAKERERCAKVCDALAKEECEHFKFCVERSGVADAAYHDAKRMAFDDAASAIRGETE